MKKIIEYMNSKRPHEGCGFFTSNGFMSCRNVAKQPCIEFQIAPDDWIRAGDVKAIIHSHPNDDRYLSSHDRLVQVQTQLPWWLVANSEIYQYRPVDHLLGREFKYGIADCYTLVRDAYHLVGIELPKVGRKKLLEDIRHQTVLEKMSDEANGFYRVKSAQKGDVLLLRDGDRVCHMAIYLGGNEILHHFNSQLSKREQLNINTIDSIWRHRKWLPLSFTAILNDLDHSMI